MDESRKSGSIAYAFETPQRRRNAPLFALPGVKYPNPIYVNVIPRFQCSNACRFCSRGDAIAGRPNIYERKAGTSLFLREAPGCEDITREVRAMLPKLPLGDFGYMQEIAFVGLGEPLAQFDLICQVMQDLRTTGYEERLRVDTNGQIKCMAEAGWPGCRTAGKHPASVLRGTHWRHFLDSINISVNATNEAEYQALCRPRFPNAFEAICGFVRDCMDAGIDTSVSFVVGFDDGTVKTRDREEYARFAGSTFFLYGERVMFREYVRPVQDL